MGPDIALRSRHSSSHALGDFIQFLSVADGHADVRMRSDLISVATASRSLANNDRTGFRGNVEGLARGTVECLGQYLRGPSCNRSWDSGRFHKPRHAWGCSRARAIPIAAASADRGTRVIMHYYRSDGVDIWLRLYKSDGSRIQKLHWAFCAIA